MTPRAVKPGCSRSFEAEAMRDGRLTGVARAHFEAHAAVCTSCAHEVRALAALGQALRERDPAEPDELHVRRERTRLLAAFDASLMPSPATTSGRRWLVLGVAAALLCGIALLLLRPPRGVPRRAAVVASARPVGEVAKVRAEPSAKWSRRSEQRLETLTLESGTLHVEVEHASSAGRLLVVLPDGELEDIGTTFTVTANSGRTTRVTVQQGRVLLRLRDRPAQVLSAGDAWSSELPAVPSSSVSTPPPSTTPGRPVTAVTDPSRDFRAALSALNGGENLRAALLFAKFSAEHPRDSRGEDAAYLRVIALQRAGALDEMKGAAVGYLRRYPSGFRREEIESLTR